jgi:hypothetical protein
MLTEAIYWHGGDARTARDSFFALPQQKQDYIIEFLKSLQVLPPGSQRVAPESSVLQPARRGRIGRGG